MDSFNTANRVNRQRETELKATIETHKQQAIKDMSQRNQIQVLKNEVKAAQDAYGMVMQHYMESNLQSQSNQTNASILTPAAEPTEPSSPKIFKNIMISVFLGMLGGIGAILAWELLDYRVRSAETLGIATGLPVMIRFTPHASSDSAREKILMFLKVFKPKRI